MGNSSQRRQIKTIKIVHGHHRMRKRALGVCFSQSHRLVGIYFVINHVTAQRVGIKYIYLLIVISIEGI